MKNKLYGLIAILAIISCQVVDGPSSGDSFVKFYGELTSYTVADIEIVYDQSGEKPENFIVFGTKLTERGDTDFVLFKIDLEGNVINSISLGYSDTLDIDEDGVGDNWTSDILPDRTYANEIASQVHVINGVGYAIIGTSSISESALNVSEWNFLTFGFFDQEFNPMPVNGDTLIVVGSKKSKSKEGIFFDKKGNDIIQLMDGSFILVGAEESENGFGGLDFDNYILKYSRERGILFDKSQGERIIGKDDESARIFEKLNGNLVVIGSSNYPSHLGENQGNNGTNVFYWETDSDGNNKHYIAYGLDDPSNNSVVYNEMVSDAIQTSAGYTIIGTSNTSQDKSYGFMMNLSQNGLFLHGNIHDSSYFNNAQNIGLGAVQTDNGNYILLGQYSSFSFEGDSRGKEGMFVLMDQTSRPIEGSEVNFGLPVGNDLIVDAVGLPDGKIVIVANLDFGGGLRLISIIKLNDDGSL